MILQIWSCDQSLGTSAFLWEKLSKSQFCKDLTKKTNFFEGCCCFKINNLGLALVLTLQFFTSMARGSKLKVWKFLGLIYLFVDVRGGELVGVAFLLHLPPPPPLWVGLKLKLNYIETVHFSFCFKTAIKLY